MTDRTPKPHSSLQGSGAERREHPRETVQLAARLVVERGRFLDIVIVDRSLKGMRIRLPTDGPLPRSVKVLVLQELMAHEGDVVWTRQGEAGLLLRASVSVRTAAGAEGETLRQLWRTAWAR